MPIPKPERSYTIDGVQVHAGLRVWDYDLRRARVLGELSYNPYEGTVWWRTDTGMFDGARMWRRHPRTGEVA